MVVNKRIERTVEIKYHWIRYEGVKPEHIEALEESAMDRINQMMAKGYSQGELHDNINMTDDDNGGIEYNGYWKATTNCNSLP